MNRCLVVFLFIIIGLPIYSQDLSLMDLNTALYSDLQRWEAAGHIIPLHQLQPYSYATITHRLHNMLSSRDLPEHVRKKGNEYLSLLQNFEAHLRFGAKQLLRVTETGHHFNFYPFGGFQWLLSNDTSIRPWAEFNYPINVLDSENITALPLGERETQGLDS